MTAPSSLPPVRRPRPSGVHENRRPWWGKPDALCVLAILLALAGIFPHAASSLAEIIRALRAVPTPAGLHQTVETDPKSGDGKKDGKRDGEHAGSLLSIPASASATAAPVGTLIVGDGAQVP